MNINWSLRLKNKATIVALISALVVFIYSVATALGVTLPVAQDQIMNAVTAVLSVLAALGIVVDPTTQGVSDSTRAMMYDYPAATSGATPGDDASE